MTRLFLLPLLSACLPGVVNKNDDTGNNIDSEAETDTDTDTDTDSDTDSDTDADSDSDSDSDTDSDADADYAELTVTNWNSTESIYYLVQIDYSNGDLYELTGSYILGYGDSLTFEIAPNIAWQTLAISDYSYCVFTDPYTVQSGQAYTWDVYDFPYYWDGSTCQ
ncbi:MAG TPA: hypothetical protein PLA94_17805 [Myxococcota bacterium]|nr:hypothetical protein [Myxococcota bacterium]HND31865.1 hypothetical protein [Myxococcota bacterium]